MSLINISFVYKLKIDSCCNDFEDMDDSIHINHIKYINPNISQCQTDSHIQTSIIIIIIYIHFYKISVIILSIICYIRSNTQFNQRQKLKCD